MPSTCILTDNTAQFPHGIFPGQQLIRSFPLHVDGRSVSVPAVDDFVRLYRELEQEFSAILVLTLSGRFLPVARAAYQAAMQHGGTARVAVLDSQQVGIGLGLLARIGAQAVLEEQPLPEVEKHIRAAIPHIYTLIHADAETLVLHGYLDPRQLDGETLGIFPLFVLESGQFTPYKKVRTRRHLLESFQEFIEEFETPQQIAFMRGKTSMLRSRPLREVAKEFFPQVPFSEVDMPLALAGLFGPQAVGVTVLELPVR